MDQLLKLRHYQPEMVDIAFLRGEAGAEVIETLLLDPNNIHGYDAVHLGTALNPNQQLVAAGETALIFLSADDRLNAADEGLALVIGTIIRSLRQCQTSQVSETWEVFCVQISG